MLSNKQQITFKPKQNQKWKKNSYAFCTQLKHNCHTY